MELEKLLFLLSKAEQPNHILFSLNIYGITSRKFKTIVALENYDKDIIPNQLSNLAKSDAHDFVSYFSSENLFFVDEKLLEEINDGKSVDFPLDYSIMVDSNYASYIHRFINADTIDFNNNVFTTISILLKERFNYDYWFYLLENYKDTSLHMEFDLQIFIKEHQDLHSNLVSLELFKSINIDEFKDSNRIIYTISKEQAVNNANKLIEDLYCSESGKEFLNQFIFIQKQMTLILIGILKINFKSGKNAAKKVSELFEYMNEIVGAYFDREMILAHKYFNKPGGFRIFSKIQKRGKTSDLLKKIENISWDFIVPRVMEYFMKNVGEGRFYLPFFLSHDRGLKDIMDLYKVKGVFFNEEIGPLPLTSETNVEYFEKEGCTIDFEFYFSNENKQKRARILKRNRQSVEELIQKEFQELVEILGN